LYYRVEGGTIEKVASHNLTMNWNIAEISRTARKFYHAQHQSEAERLRLELMPAVDLDEATFAVFADYVEELQSIGVLLESEALQDTLNGYPQNIEAAIEAVLEYVDRLHEKDQAFQDRYHATNCLTKALREGWQPSRQN
jgi:hypothetical protein